MFAGLVTGRYRQAFEDQPHAAAGARPSWVRRMIAALFGRKP
jgi:hypothetical protein